jgi:uncharacterized membrane protein HdeD (DUF308 family)
MAGQRDSARRILPSTGVADSGQTMTPQSLSISVSSFAAIGRCQQPDEMSQDTNQHSTIVTCLRIRRRTWIMNMSAQPINARLSDASTGWLKSYYFLRFAFGAIWVLLAFTIAKKSPALAAVMLVAYPAWDALANYVDAIRSGGLRRNKAQFCNFIFSALIALAVGIALGESASAVLIVFALWATLTGLFQLATGVSRWKSESGQWPMILSGAQSAAVGFLFVKMANAPHPVAVTSIAGYAALGAFYFFVSAIWLTVKDARRKAEPVRA